MSDRFNSKVIDVLGVVRELNIRGKVLDGEYSAKCSHPGHRDKLPSWSINVERTSDLYGVFYCFGCTWSGGVIDLVAMRKGLTRIDAYKWIEDKGFLEDNVIGLPTIELSNVDPSRFGVIEEPSEVVVKPLNEWPTLPRRYVLSRGLGSADVNRWGIGYAVDGRLEGRIYIPVNRADGELVGYSARSFCPGIEPKYLGPGVAKVGQIFGEHEWPESSGRIWESVFICEGVINAIACSLVGAEYVGAICGSRIDCLHVMKISSFGRVIIATDPDEAGDRVSVELIRSLKPHSTIDRIDFPEGIDAADLLARDFRKLEGLVWAKKGKILS